MRPVDRELLRLAVPALGALLAEPLYVLADTAVVGHLGTTELGGLAVASAALLFGYGLCIFLAYGTTAAVARLTGAGEVDRAAHQAVQGLWLALALGVVLALLGAAFATPVLRLLGADGETLPQAGTYLRISLLGAPAMLMMLAGVGYLRGVKDTIRPLWVAAGTAVVNLVLEVILIYGFDQAIANVYNSGDTSDHHGSHPDVADLLRPNRIRRLNGINLQSRVQAQDRQSNQPAYDTTEKNEASDIELNDHANA